MQLIPCLSSVDNVDTWEQMINQDTKIVAKLMDTLVCYYHDYEVKYKTQPEYKLIKIRIHHN